ncbi:MAG: substrate-binding domain-containing protein [Dorea sp.]|nr:substrate-binding domain-containing protein [Dorea sp.]
MKRKLVSLLLVAAMVLAMAGCSSGSDGSSSDGGDAQQEEEAKTEGADATEVANAKALADQSFDTSYEPKKDTYKIYCTYKLVHAWYDAIEVGVKAAVEDLKSKGVTIDYEWYAPVEPDAVDQVNSIETAVGQGYDLIAVDVNQVETTEPAVNDAVKAGVKVALFASSDLPNTERSFFVGNNDNYGDGAAIAEAVCKKMEEDGKKEIAFLSGTIGAVSHEDRLKAFYDTVEKHPDIEVVDDQRDNDFVEKAVQITEAWIVGGISAARIHRKSACLLSAGIDIR